MGLALSVGGLADFEENDEDGAARFVEQMADVNMVLRHAGFAEHVEPTECEVWCVDGYGYSGLHALREVAGLVWRGLPIPTSGILTAQDTQNGDKLFEAALSLLASEKPQGFLGRLFRKNTVRKCLPFIHLVCHSDAEGYYVPIDFPIPLVPNVMRSETASIWPLGSVQRLQREISDLAEALEIPVDLQSQSDEMWEALDQKAATADDPVWRAQPIATYSALIPKEACDASLATGAAISFG